jgi:hypothetical protein
MPERQRLMRIWYQTDMGLGSVRYVGTLSAVFPAEDATHRIVGVDWSESGEVEVTWLIGWEAGDPQWVPRAVEEVEPL